jgi:gamma-glutamylcysteine synthetase
VHATAHELSQHLDAVGRTADPLGIGFLTLGMSPSEIAPPPSTADSPITRPASSIVSQPVSPRRPSSRSELIEWFSAGEKPHDAFAIGTEHEKVPFYRADPCATSCLKNEKPMMPAGARPTAKVAPK